MEIVDKFFRTMRMRGVTFKNLYHLLELFLAFLDLDHPDLVTQTDRYSFITVLKHHVENPTTYRLPDWRRYGLYDTHRLQTDMDVDSPPSSDSGLEIPQEIFEKI